MQQDTFQGHGANKEASREEIQRTIEAAFWSPPHRGLKRGFRISARILAIAVVVISLACLLGHFIPSPFLQRWISRGPAITANTTVAFALGGISLWLLMSNPRRKGARAAAKILGGITFAIGAYAFLERLIGIRSGVDQWLVQSDSFGAGRMSPYTSLVFIFLGPALVLLDSPFWRKIHLSNILAVVGGIFGFITLLEYAYGVEVYLTTHATQVSLPTATLSFLLAAGLLCARPGRGFAIILTSPTVGGKLMRRLLLLLAIVPPLLGWIGLVGQWRNWYGSGLGAALIVTGSMLFFGGVVLRLGSTLLKTELRRAAAERLLLAREFDFRATFEHAAVGIAHMGLDGHWIRVNDRLCEIIGYPREELLQKTFRDVTVPEDMERCLLFVQRLIEGEIPHYSIEKRYLRKDGSTVWGHLTVTMLHDASGKPKYALVILEDITERKKVLEEVARQKANLEAAAHTKDRLLAMISHELRTPLTPVLAAISSCPYETLPPQQRDVLEMVRRNIEHEICLVDDILDLTRLSNGKLRLNMRPVDLHALITEVFAEAGPVFREKGLSARLSLHASKPIVQADPARLRQILLNLLDNAKKFTPPGGRITVATASKGGQIITKVSDTGAGISPENLQRIFEAFEQGAPSVQRRFGGLGLGLAITKGLVEAHEGSMSVKSLGPGRGSTFFFSLPTLNLAKQPAQTAQPARPRPEPQPAQARTRTAPTALRILLVEDHDDTRLVLQHFLERQGYKVKAETNVPDAVAAASRESFDLLITDIGLASGNGRELLKAATLACGHPLPGIALSGFTSEEDIRLSAQAGFFRHLSKPIDLRALKEAINLATS